MNLVFAADSLYDAVANDLASRYCPVDRSVFLGRLGILLAALACVALLLFAFAKFRSRNAQRKTTAYIAACAVALFAIGYGVLVIVGLSGCGAATEAGLTWDWPW
jgi:ABC-type polysaccharide/polyol phosphate export permease